MMAGGLIGVSYGGTITSSYSTSSVAGGGAIGGLLGSRNGDSSGITAVVSSYWDIQASGTAIGIGAGSTNGSTGLSGSQTKQQASFAGFDFSSNSPVWRIYEGRTAPLLTSFLTPLAVASSTTTSKVYDGIAYTGSLGAVGYSDPNAPTSGHLFGVSNLTGNTYSSPVNAGAYLPDLWSDQMGYSISYVNGTLTISPAALQVTANNASKTYGDTITLNGSAFSSSGLQNSESIGSVSLTSSGAVATAGVAGGPYAITPSSASGGTFNPANYNISYVNGTLTITPANISVAADNKSREYGDANVLTATVTGLRAGDTNSVVTGLNTAATSSSEIGSYAIDASAASAGTNYTVTSTTDGTLAVAPAPLAIRADDKTKIQTQPNPPLAATISGFKLGQDQSVLGGVLALNTTAETNSPAGNFPITASGLTSTNYTISFVDGNLKVISVTNPSIPGAPEHGYDGAVDNAHGGNSNHHDEGDNGRHKGNGYAFGRSKDKDRDERSGNEERNEGSAHNFEHGSRMQLSGLPIALEGSGVHLPEVAGKRGE
jgi:hypothetical protein